MILAPTPDVGQPWPEGLKKAWAAALSLAEHNDPDGLGYPWVDQTSGAVVISVVNPAGRAAVDLWRAAGAQAKGPKTASIPRPDVAVATRNAKFSYAQLQSIMDNATRLVVAGVPDADAIWATGPDFENNRIIITVDRQSPRLFAALAALYGTEAIAVRVDPNRERPVPLSRLSDSAPFWGGARINTPTGQQCTSNFSWMDSTHYYMFTAGHCGPSGGAYSTPVQAMGSVTATSRENWSTSTGTQLFPNDGTYRGDISLIQVTAPTGTQPYMYKGAYNTSSSAGVKEMWWGAPTPGDQFCTGGSFSGEICGFTVSYGAGSVRGMVDGGGGVWWRGVTQASKSGPCTQNGDSGAPVYTVRADGLIAAKGILDANNFFGCNTIWFTDMDLAYYGVPGWLQTVP